MLKKKIFSKNIKFFLLIFIITLSFFVFGKANAGTNDNVSGWAWSENIGWISFNCNNPELPQPRCSPNYGVKVSTSTGDFSGYAWSENIGWISFEESDLVGCPPIFPSCKANLNLQTNEVSGWAKALDIQEWIRLRNSTYGIYRNSSTNEFEDWAWSDQTIGWISFNSATGGGPIQYAVVIDIDTIDPEATSFGTDPSDPNWINGADPNLTVSWTVTDGGGSHLNYVEVWRADDVGGSPGTWTMVGDNYYAPVGSDFWASSTTHSTSDYLQDGIWWYGLHVIDNNGNWADEGGPVKVRVDTTEPNSQIQSPSSGTWYSNDFSLDTLDEDLGSGLDNGLCEYKIIPYEDTNGDGIAETERTSSGWLSRTCNSLSTIITVGTADYCKYQAEDACWVNIHSTDNAGNQHSESVESGSIKNYHIDWTYPEVGIVSPVIAEQGVEQTFSASLSDAVGRVPYCWFYVDGQSTSTEFITISPSPCENGASCTVTTTHQFLDPGDYSVRFACQDAASNLTWGISTSVSVSETNAPIITSLGYFTSHSSTPGQQCTDQFVCCTEPTTQTDCNIKFNISAYDPDGSPLGYTWDFGDGAPESNEEDPSHYYYTANTYNAVVDVFDGIDHTYDSLGVLVTNPTVSVSLTADPSFGINSLSNVDLSTIVSGSMSGTISYRFDCTNNGDWELEALHQSVSTFTAVDLCNYASSGIYTAKVSIDRGDGNNIIDTTEINVETSECIPDQQTNCTSPQGCPHTITCQQDGTWPSCPTNECVKDSTRSCENCGEQICSSTCEWGVCEGGEGCTVGPDCPDCPCLPDVCVGQDYYDYPDFGDCDASCVCNTGANPGEPCELNIIIDDLRCNEAPVCDSLIAAPEQGAAPVEISFTGLGHDNDGSIIDYGFIFGDGSSSTTTFDNISHIYNTPGTYCAKLKIKDNDGVWSATPGDCPDVCAKQINISENTPPVASVACDGSGCGPGSACDGIWVAYNRNCDFYFLNQSTDLNSTNPPDNNDDIIKSTWSIFYQGGTPWQDPYVICNDDDQTQENEAICDILMPLLPASENYYVALTVEDKAEVTDQQNKNFYVKSEIATDFQCSSAEGGWQSCDGFVSSEGEIVEFQDITIVSEGATGISSWIWTFEDGDPATSNIQNPSASFVNIDGSSGTVTLEVTDDTGRIDTQSYQLQITIPLPEWYEVTPF
ncbi:MAG: PKD domain-containing protein [Patescibacteria group bacterium]|nr:PKD domain-containing protein [Patescibacteria group bacterium]